MSQWVREKKRWALLLRGGLQCVYCARGIEELLGDGEFLSLDHLVPRGAGGSHDPVNLVAACYKDNRDRQQLPVKQFCRAHGYDPSTVRKRIWRQRRTSLDRYLGQAEVLLGAHPLLRGGPAETIVRHDQTVARQWMSEMDRAYLDYIGVDAAARYAIESRHRGQAYLFCPTCGSCTSTDHQDYGF